MSKLLWIALLGIALAGCASDRSTSSGSTSGSGSTATPAPSGSSTEDMKKRGSSTGTTAPRSTY